MSDGRLGAERREVFAVNVEAVLTASQQAAVRQAPRAMLPADLQTLTGR